MKCHPVLTVSLFCLLLCPPAVAVEMRDVTYVTKDAGKVVFSHRYHMRQKGMVGNCRACHDGIFSIRKKTGATMADMALGRSCGACHNRRRAFGLQRCDRCHRTRDVVFAVSATGPTRFSHKRHLAANPDCTVCHPALYPVGRTRPVTMAEMGKGRSCGACHDGTDAFALKQCAACHPVRNVTFTVGSVGSVTFSHASHTGLYRCGDCHTAIFAASRSGKPVSMDEMGKGASCGACHDGTTAFSVKGDCDSCHAS